MGTTAYFRNHLLGSLGTLAAPHIVKCGLLRSPQLTRETHIQRVHSEVLSPSMQYLNPEVHQSGLYVVRSPPPHLALEPIVSELFWLFNDPNAGSPTITLLRLLLPLDHVLIRT